MTDTFLDNQEVTAQDLNNIAIDLGYAEYSHFPENPPQSAVSALNQITADLTTKGVLLSGNRCMVTYASNKIYVDTGIIVFESGAKKRIETTQTLDFISGVTNYIYALHDTNANKISIINSSTAPSNGDFVSLATISANGSVVYTAPLSTAKVGLSAGNSKQIINFSKSFYFDQYTTISTISLADWNNHEYAFYSFSSNIGGYIETESLIDTISISDTLTRPYFILRFVKQEGSVKVEGAVGTGSSGSGYKKSGTIIII